MANVIINSPRKRGTVASIDGTTFTKTSGTDFTSTDVGRIIMMQTGDSRGYYRRITGFTNATTVTVDAPWGVSAFRTVTDLQTGNLHTETAPVAGDTFAVSKTWSEVIDEIVADTINDANSTALTTEQKQGILEDVDGNGRYYRFNTTFVRAGDSANEGLRYIFRNYVVVYDEDVTVEWRFSAGSSTNRIEIRNNENAEDGFASVVLGRQNLGDTTDSNINGYPSNGCTVIDTSTSPGNYDNQGIFEINGGKYIVTSTSTAPTFLRMNDANSSTNDGNQQFRMWNVQVSGNFGARVSGDRSVLFGCVSTDNASTLGMFSPIAPGIYQDVATRGNAQGVYFFPQLTGDSEVAAQAIQDISTRVLFMNRTTAETESTTQTISNWSIDGIESEVSAGASLLAVGGSADFEHTFEIVKDYQLSYTNSEGTGKVMFEDAEGNTSTATDGGDGEFDAQRLKAYEWTGNTAITNFEDSSVTQYYPHDWATKYRNQNLVTGDTNLHGPIGLIEESYPVSDDNNITETDTSIVDAYTDIDNAAQLYDFADKLKYDQMAYPTLQTQWFRKSGDTVTMTNSYVPVEFDSDVSGDTMQINRSFTFESLAQDGSGGVSADERWGLRDAVDFEDADQVTGQNDWANWANEFLHVRFSSRDNAYDFYDQMVRVAQDGGNLDLAFDTTNTASPFTYDDATASFTVATATYHATDHEHYVVIGLLALQSGSTGTPPGTAGIGQLQMSTEDGMELIVKSQTSGYEGGIVAANSTVHFDTTIRGAVEAQIINFKGTTPSTIIDTTGAINGVMYLPAGTYTINDADITDLTIRRIATDTGDVIISVNSGVSGADSVTLGTGVQLEISLQVTISGAGNSSDGKMHFWDSDDYAATISEQTGTDVTIRSGDVSQLTSGNSITYVWSHPGYDDIRGVITLAAGANTATHNTSSQGLPTDTVTATSTATYNISTNVLTVDVSGADEGRLTRGETNVFVNDVKDLDAYLQAVAESTVTDIVSSQGASGFASAERANIIFTPGENATQQLEYIEPLGSGSESIAQNLTVSATIDGNTEDVTFTMDIPTSPPTFDGAFIQSVVDGAEDDINAHTTTQRKKIIGAVYGA